MVDTMGKSMADSVGPVLSVLEGFAFLRSLLRPLNEAIVRVRGRPNLFDLVLHLLLTQIRKLLVCTETILLL
jgi:hypothetical protein